MKSYFSAIRILLLILTTSFCSSTFAQWSNLNSLSNHAFIDLSFPSEQTGYAIANQGGFSGNALYTTQNAGMTWQELTLDLDSINSPDLQSIFFANAQTGYMTVRARLGTLKIFLLKTQDGGNIWTNVTPDSLPVGYGISDVHFINATHGFVISGNRIYRTTDGGLNWSTSLKLQWDGFNEIHFHDSLFGVAGAWDGTFAYLGSIFTTSDGGQSWDSLFIPQYGSAIGKVMHVGDSTAFALGDQGWPIQKMYITTNNGNSWDTLALSFLADSSDTAVDLYFEDADNGYLITTSGYIYRTYDGGQNWMQVHGKDQGLRDIVTNGKSFFVGGAINTLLTHPNTLSIKDEISSLAGFIYPNPCSRSETLHFMEPIQGDLRILDLNGKLIFSQKMRGEKELAIQGLGLVPGVYVIEVVGGGVVRGRLVIRD